MFINHCHTAPEGCFDEKKIPNKGTLEGLKEVMDEAKVERAVAFAPFPHFMPQDASWYSCNLSIRECNEWLYKSLQDKKYKNMVGFATIDPKEKESCEILEEYTKKGFKGVKMHPPIFRFKIDDSSLDGFYNTAEKLGMALLFHTGVHGWRINEYFPILLDNVAQRHPKLKIIIEHTIGWGANFFTFDQSLAVLQNNPNTYAGITGSFEPILPHMDKSPVYNPKARLLLLLKVIGAERIIYGLDYPYGGLDKLKKDIKFIYSLKISRKEKELILGRNLEKLLGIE